MSDYLSKIDELISRLETAIEDADRIEFELAPGQTPKSAVFRNISSGFAGTIDRNSHGAEVFQVHDGIMTMRSRSDVPRGSKLEVQIMLGKDAKGESVSTMQAVVLKTSKVSGAYEIEVKIDSLEHEIIPATRRFVEWVSASNHNEWNRWCADLADGPILTELDLSGTILCNFDLCCANLTGSNLDGADLSGTNLSGANLDKCSLEGVRISGADLFRARIPRKYMGLLLASGTVEAESVIFT